MSRCYRVELPSSGAQRVVRGYEILCQSKNKCNTVCKWPALMHSSNTDLSLKKLTKKIILVMLIWTLSEKTKQACDSTHLNSLCIKNLFEWKCHCSALSHKGTRRGLKLKLYSTIHWFHNHTLTCCNWWLRPLVGSSSSACLAWDARLYLGITPEAQS